MTATQRPPRSDAVSTPGARSTWDWLASEVPGIVSGLAATGSISNGTAVAADRLIRMEKYDRALTLALEEATHRTGR